MHFEDIKLQDRLELFQNGQDMISEISSVLSELVIPDDGAKSTI